MRVCTFVNDGYGKRITNSLKKYSPWHIDEIELDTSLPQIIDDPEEFIPDDLPESDIVLFLCQDAGAIQLLPSLVKKTKSGAVIVGIDKAGWLDLGLQKQIERELDQLNVGYVFARPLCSPPEESDNKEIREFTEHFGRPEFELVIEGDKIKDVKVKRRALCSCSDFVAKNLKGVRVSKAVEEAGLLHHNYPCMASMDKDRILGDTPMHVAAYITKKSVKRALKYRISDSPDTS